MDKNWNEMTLDEKREERFRRWLSPKGVDFISPEAGAMYRERVMRLQNVIQLKLPDRVPVYPAIGFFPAYYAGITPEEAMYDYDKLSMAWKKYLFDFMPDVFPGAAVPGSGRAFDTLNYKMYKWPGNGLPPEQPYQTIEGEYMTADEYDDLIQDPTYFWMRILLPRIFGTLEPFKYLPQVVYSMEMAFSGGFIAPFGMPQVQDAFETLFEAGREALKWRAAVGKTNKYAIEAGFPIPTGGATKAPFDVIGDTLRGTRGIMFDMFRQPDKLLEAMERLTPLMIKMGVSGAAASGNPLIFIPLHKGADGFMSEDQFNTFYWPTLKKVVLGLIEEGLVPYLFAEGGYESRLEIIKDLPEGSVLWKFDLMDMEKAKATVGKTACIEGNVPVSLMATSEPDKVTEYCRNLIDTVGKDGGFILSTGAPMDTAKPENVHALIESVKEYGIYQS